jgi:hypothetical protein
MDAFTRLKLAYAFFNQKYVDFYALKHRYAFLKRMEGR